MNDKQKEFLRNTVNNILLRHDPNGNLLPEIVPFEFENDEAMDRYLTALMDWGNDLVEKANRNETVRHTVMTIIEFIAEMIAIFDQGYSGIRRGRDVKD